MYPDELRYTAEHEWVRSTESGTIVFGITDYAQDSLGDVVFVEAPDVGTEVAVERHAHHVRAHLLDGEVDRRDHRHQWQDLLCLVVGQCPAAPGYQCRHDRHHWLGCSRAIARR